MRERQESEKEKGSESESNRGGKEGEEECESLRWGARIRVRECVQKKEESVCTGERERETWKVCELDRAIDYYAKKNGRAPNLTAVHCCHSCGTPQLKYISATIPNWPPLFIFKTLCCILLLLLLL